MLGKTSYSTYGQYDSNGHKVCPPTSSPGQIINRPLLYILYQVHTQIHVQPVNILGHYFHRNIIRSHLRINTCIILAIDKNT